MSLSSFTHLIKALSASLLLCASLTAYAQSFVPSLALDKSDTPFGHAVKQALESKVQKTGSVRLIVKLRTPARPEHLLDFSQILTQRQMIFAAQDALLKKLAIFGARQHRQFDTLPFVVIEAGDQALAQLLKMGSEIASIQEDSLMQASLAQSVPLIGGDKTLAAGATGAGQAIAIVDTGVDAAHPFLAGKVVAEACYSSTGSNSSSVCPNGTSAQTGKGAGANCAMPGCEHGTHVAGIVAGNGPNFSGVAKDAKIIAVQVFTAFHTGCASPPCLSAYTSDIMKGLEYVYSQRNNLAIAAVNLSLGGGSYTSHCDGEALKTPIDNLRAAGIATIAASGNDGNAKALASPACISSAISVGAVSKSDAIASYSNSAKFLTMLAPGTEIISSIPGTAFAPITGTSMATPHVAGAWAVLKSKKPTASVTEISNALTSSGKSIYDKRNYLFKPRIKVDAALTKLAGVQSTTTSTSTTSTTTTTSSTTTTTAPSCYTSSNYAHVTAGRARASGMYAYANGSNQNMGLNNTFTIKTLKKTGTNYYVIGSCS